METFRHGQWVVGIPEGWSDASTVALVGPPREGFSPNITVTVQALEKKCSAQEYAGQELEKLRGALQGRQYQVHQEGFTTIGDVKAYQRIHSFLPENMNRRVRQVQVYLIEQGRAVTLTGSDLEEKFEESRDTLTQAIHEFSFADE
jgi:hypothetical protein